MKYVISEGEWIASATIISYLNGKDHRANILASLAKMREGVHALPATTSQWKLPSIAIMLVNMIISAAIAFTASIETRRGRCLLKIW